MVYRIICTWVFGSYSREDILILDRTAFVPAATHVNHAFVGGALREKINTNFNYYRSQSDHTVQPDLCRRQPAMAPELTDWWSETG